MNLEKNRPYRFTRNRHRALPLFLSRVPAGLPLPADEWVDRRLDLNEYCVKHPLTTFYLKVDGNSMIGAGIFDGDVIVIDRALEVRDGAIIVALLDGEFTVKRYRVIKGKAWLYPENPEMQPIEIKKNRDFEVWGVVTRSIHEPK